ncbi:hypothetical protein STEPF1_07159 [Streptomyces sp. F-1]|nr:hypothetical protein STEPF1_07159 [Streptomyces sp. F-1]
MTEQPPGQIDALRSRCRPRSFTGTVQMCLLPPLPPITSLRVKASTVPSGDQVGWASPPVCCPAGGTISCTIAPVVASAIRMRPGWDAEPTPPGETRVKARYLPSGDNVGSVSQSSGPRPASGIATAWVPSASVVQIRSIRPWPPFSNRVTTMRRPSGV